MTYIVFLVTILLLRKPLKISETTEKSSHQMNLLGKWANLSNTIFNRDSEF